jgi:succinate dehydrogenase/fumarate reductase-like Fe-S protein
MSVTNVLDYIYENLDSSLAYYTSCHRGVCGRCLMIVNGKTRLACIELVTDNLTLNPLPNHRVIRDLVVEGV